MAKQLRFHDDARTALRSGIDQLANAVRLTLGPLGRNVVFDRPYATPIITNDGVTIASEISLQDDFEDMGAQLAKMIASKTNDIAGDGTTTATVLGQAIVHEGLKNVAAGADPMALRRGLEAGARALREQLNRNAIKITTREQMAQVAAISAGSEEIGQLIGDVMEQVGKDGVITVEESKGLRTEVEYVEGMAFDRGYVSPYFVTDGSRMEAVIEDAAIFMTDRKLSSVNDLLTWLDPVLQVTRNLVIIAEDVDGEALATLALNKMRGNLNVVAVKAPGYGDRRKEYLEDIATLTGGQLISPDLGHTLQSVRPEHLGHARRVIATKDETAIIEGRGSRKAIEARQALVRAEASRATNDWDREHYEQRLGKLAGLVAVIKVGAPTEPELTEKKHRVEDALSATRAAIQEGIVPGGGVAFINAAGALDKVKLAHADEQTGVRILRRAIEEPLRRIAANAGEDGAVIIAEIQDLPKMHGWDAAKNRFGNMIDFGIIDPAKVTRAALDNAVSIAGLVLTTEVLVTDIPQPRRAAPAPSDEMY